MPGKKNSLANGLLQQLLDGERLNKLIKDIKEFIDCELNALEYTASLVKMEVDLLLEDLYLGES